METMLHLARTKPHMELEIKVFPETWRKRIQLDNASVHKCIARILAVLPDRKTETYMTVALPDNVRAVVTGASNIQKVCLAGTLADLPVKLEEKRRYLDHVRRERGTIDDAGIDADTLDVVDAPLRVTLRVELPYIRKVIDIDPEAHIRIIQRWSFTRKDGGIRCDISYVRTGLFKEGMGVIIGRQGTYEVEFELIGPTEGVPGLMAAISRVLQVYQESRHLLRESARARYLGAFKTLLEPSFFVYVVPFRREHLNPSSDINVLRGYTVTEKADGLRSMLYVADDRKVLRIDMKDNVAWTGWTMLEDKDRGAIIDGEYMEELQLFRIFDILAWRGKNVTQLPLFIPDEDNQTKFRLGLCNLFAAAPKQAGVGAIVPRIEVKDFVYAEGHDMFAACAKILDTPFPYDIDGLIFTPAADGYGTHNMKKRAWMKLLKWKPDQTIDFLVQAPNEPRRGTRDGKPYFTAELFVGYNGETIIHPCLQLTGEYEPPKLHGQRDYVKMRFQPSMPFKENAYEARLYYDEDGFAYTTKPRERIEMNSIIEFSYDVAREEWIPLRIRHDKNARYRRGDREFGNNFDTAQDNWTLTHFPVTPAMIRTGHGIEFDEDSYYEVGSNGSRSLEVYRQFHNSVKSTLYDKWLKPGNTLFEVGSGRGGDLHKWMKSKVGRVIGVDVDEAGFVNTNNGACKRVLEAQRAGQKPPHCIFVHADAGKSLQVPADAALSARSEVYLDILWGNKPAHTDALKTFEGAFKAGVDVIAIQFVVHYFFGNTDTLDTFIANVKAVAKEGTVFMGTCMDGASVFAELLKEPVLRIMNGRDIAAEIRRDFDPAVTVWHGNEANLGMPITVYYDTFAKPFQEYLVPFEVLVDRMKGAGFVLEETHMFKDIHTPQQSKLSPEQQHISFLHRTFAFRYVGEAARTQPDTTTKKITRKKKTAITVVKEDLPPPPAAGGAGKEDAPLPDIEGEGGDAAAPTPEDSKTIILDKPKKAAPKRGKAKKTSE
jgi:hypothetical protein